MVFRGACRRTGSACWTGINPTGARSHRESLRARERYRSPWAESQLSVSTTTLPANAVSAILGLVAGFFFSRIAILVSGLVLAVLSATLLQHEGFSFLEGIAIIVVCLSLNQIAYRIGATLVHRAAKKRYASLPHGHPHDDPGESGHKHIAHEYKR